MTKFRSLVSLLALLLCAIAGFAQGTTSATLTGTVITDGAPLPGVTVTVSSPALQGTRTAVTNENGVYNFASLPPGEYRVSFMLDGMQEVTKTVRLTLSQTARADASMRVGGVAEAITVTASAPTTLETTEVSTNINQELLDDLPIGRTINAAATLAPGVSEEGPNNQLVISGAPSYENLYLVNGAVVNDTIRGQPEQVYIEDAIQETTILTGNVSAEYGRFTGGVVSAITKSGGNEFSGSLRDSLTRDDWTKATPFRDPVTGVRQAARSDELNEVYEATLGGRIIRDRLWFFLAGRMRETAGSNQTIGTNIPFAQTDEETRWEAKLTGQITDKHSVVVSYLDRVTEQTNNTFGAIVDTRSLTSRELPNTLKALNYNGILTDNLLLEFQGSQRDFAFVGGGATERDRIFGTMIRDIATGRRGFSPTFCGVCSDKTRNNEYYVLKSSYFLSTSRLGTHNLVAGVEDFSELRNENNDQGGSGYRVFGDFLYQGQDVFLRMRPGVSFIQNFPILNLSKTSDSTTQSLFINDKWELNKNLSFNVGARYDKNDGKDQAGNKTADDAAVSPRLGATYDLFGDGRHRIVAGYNRYVSKIDNGVNDSASNAGAPAYFGYTYNGPGINLGATGPYVPTAEVLRQVFAWFDSIGGDRANADRGVSLPGLNVRLDGQLDSPSQDELSIGYGLQIGSNGYFRGDYIHRDFQNFYVSTQNLGTGTVTTPTGTRLDLTLVGNDDRGLERVYDAVQLQAGYRLGQRFNLGGNYTWSELRGNADSETFNNATITLSSSQNLPEYIRPDWNNPIRALNGDVEHRLTAYASYDLPTPVGNFNLSLLQRYHSGYPYYASAAIDPRFNATRNPNGIVNPGYVTPPATVTYYFLDAGEFRTDDVTRTDIGVNYSLPIRAVSLFVSGDIINVFNEDAVEDPSFIEQRVFVNRTRSTLRGFNPMTETPQEGVHYALDPNFGKPTSKDAYQLPLTYRFSVGLRF
jgi:outer membrane receptor for ferrienterochelin and colicin